MKKEKKKKNPFVSLLLSALLPGLGQVYNNQVQKGLFFIIFNMIINLLLKKPLSRFIELPSDLDRTTLVVLVGYSIAGLILWIYAMVDAKKVADYINLNNK